LIDLHPGDNDLFGKNDAFDNGPNNQADNEDTKDDGMLNTPPSIRDEDLTPPRPPPKTTRSPPKTSTRAPTLRYDVCVSFRKPKERFSTKLPDTIVTQYTIYRATNAYRQTEFYKALTNKARHNLLNTPPYSAWKDLQGPFIPKFDFATPMFKVALKDKSCHLFKAYPKEEDLAQMPEPGIFLKNGKPDSEHVRFFVTFECNISQKTVLRAIKLENIVEVTDFSSQEDYSTPAKNLLQAADRRAYLLTSQPTEAAAVWMAALPTYSRELTEGKTALESGKPLQLLDCSPEIKIGAPATLPRRSTSDTPFHTNNAGKLHRNFERRTRCCGYAGHDQPTKLDKVRRTTTSTTHHQTGGYGTINGSGSGSTKPATFYHADIGSTRTDAAKSVCPRQTRPNYTTSSTGEAISQPAEEGKTTVLPKIQRPTSATKLLT